METLRITLTKKMTREIGAEKAEFVANTVAAAVRGRRVEIEAGGKGLA